MLKCPLCKFEAEGPFCSQCGTKKEDKVKCVGCSKELDPRTENFCSTCGRSVASGLPEDRESKNYVNPSRESIKEKLNLIRKRRLERCSLQTEQSPNLKRNKKETYKITFGWIKKCGETCKYVMPRQGGGARKTDVPRSATYEEILDIACDLFSLTKSDNSYIGNYNGEPFPTKISCEQIVKDSKFVKLPRIYVVTKIAHTSSSADDDTQLVTSDHETDSKNDSCCSLSPPTLTPQKPEAEFVNIPVTMEEVNDFVQKLVMEEEYNPDDSEGAKSLTGDKSGFIPIYKKNTAVQYFVDLMKANGKDYEVVASGWGQFVLLPDEDFKTYLKVRDGLDITNLAFVCPPILYFISLKGLGYQYFSENVIELESGANEEYTQWIEEMKRSFKK